MLAYSNNGQSFRAVDADYAAQSGEVLFDDYATPSELAVAFSGYSATSEVGKIKQQIAALEAQQTPRRVREALAGTDGGWLSELNDQIVALRSKL